MSQESVYLILKMTGKEMSLKEIGKELDISENAVSHALTGLSARRIVKFRWMPAKRRPFKLWKAKR